MKCIGTISVLVNGQKLVYRYRLKMTQFV